MNAVINNNTIISNDDNVVKYGIYLFNCSEIDILDNTFKNNNIYDKKIDIYQYKKSILKGKYY